MSALRAVLRLVCPDRPGLVADVSGMLFRLGANILHADQHLDREAATFFQRIEFELDASAERASVERELKNACRGWRMQFWLRFWTGPKPRIAILASRRGHCPLDLLFRHRVGELWCEVPFVLSNHEDLATEVEGRGYRFIHEPILGNNKQAQEARIASHLEAEAIDVIVLARYMQILSAPFVERWPERIVNIHHSFLPAFAGADPYRQAYRKGVKLIGATSHYVTAELDQGPIIAQDVVRVSHRDSVEEMERKGRDIERVVLAHAVRCHLEERIIAYGNRTVVFE